MKYMHGMEHVIMNSLPQNDPIRFTNGDMLLLQVITALLLAILEAS